MLLGADIWRAIRVVVMGARGIHQDLLVQAKCFYFVLEDSVGRRATADVAHADKKNGVGFHYLKV